jgi:hypothetical protein
MYRFHLKDGNIIIDYEVSGNNWESEPLTDFIREREAIRRWEAGEKPSFSTGVCESLTCGYGRLDDSGYFEFPLYPAERYLYPLNPRD